MENQQYGFAPAPHVSINYPKLNLCLSNSQYQRPGWLFKLWITIYDLIAALYEGAQNHWNFTMIIVMSSIWIVVLIATEQSVPAATFLSRLAQYYGTTIATLFIIVTARSRTDTNEQAQYRILFGIYLVIFMRICFAIQQFNGGFYRGSNTELQSLPSLSPRASLTPFPNPVETIHVIALERAYNGAVVVPQW